MTKLIIILGLKIFFSLVYLGQGLLGTEKRKKRKKVTQTLLGIEGQCSAVQCSAVQCSAVQCSAVQCSAKQY